MKSYCIVRTIDTGSFSFEQLNTSPTLNVAKPQKNQYILDSLLFKGASRSKTFPKNKDPSDLQYSIMHIPK